MAYREPDQQEDLFELLNQTRDTNMMPESENILNLILQEVQSLKADVKSLKADVKSLKSDVINIKSDIRILKEDTRNLKEDTKNLKEDVNNIKEELNCLKKNKQEQQIFDLKIEFIKIIRINGFRFKIFGLLGQGAFGKVYKAIEMKSGFPLAIKIIKKLEFTSENNYIKLVRQVKIQSFLNHLNIIQMYQFYMDEQNVYQLLELANDGTLYDLMRKHKRFTQTAAQYYLRCILNAVDYMHQNKILHRDIKPKNIVLNQGLPKLCDFSQAINLKRRDNQYRTTYCGTPLYQSPEIIKRQRYNEKSDVWAIGIIAYQLVIGKHPFSQNLQANICNKKVEYPEHPKVSANFKEFIQNTLNKDPSKRLSCLRLLNSSFIKIY